MRCLLVAAVAALTAACAGSPSANPAPASLATTVVRYSPAQGLVLSRLAVLPVISDAGLEGLRGTAADTLYASLQEARPRFHVVSAREALQSLERADLAQRYWEMIEEYDQTGALDSTLLREMGSTLAVRHLLQTKVAYAEEPSMTGRARTDRDEIRLYAHIWDTETGEIVWEAISGLNPDTRRQPPDRLALLGALAADLAVTLPLPTGTAYTAAFGRPGGTDGSAEGSRIRLTPWVATREGRYYYWYECEAAHGLPEDQRVYFETEEQARATGLHLSSVPECQGPPGIR